MARAVTVAVVTALVLATVSVEQESGDAEAARLNAVRERAEKGDAQAEYDLGLDYDMGVRGAPRDYAVALEWYRKAAAAGIKDARASLGRLYFEGLGVAKDYEEAARWYGCPMPSVPVLNGCKAITYKDLPSGAIALLEAMKCDARDSNYDEGSAVDLSSAGNPAYQVCCSEAPHGPCGAVVIGKVGSVWKDLTAKEGSLGFAPPCGLFIPLSAQHNGFHDVCLPEQCAPGSGGGASCVPTIWQFLGGKYRAIREVPARVN